MEQENKPIAMTRAQLDDLIQKIKKNRDKFGDLSEVAWTGEYDDLINEPKDFTEDEWEFLWSI